VRLEFTGVTGVSLPHRELRGLSNSILEQSQDGRDYAITMQSGDIIRISAEDFQCIEPE
jgi:hypothetical protein